MRFLRKYGGLIFAIGLLALSSLSYLKRQEIYDWVRLYNYQPPASIAKLAADTTLDDEAKNLFYVQHPELDDKTSFNTHCKGDEQTIILGCYVPRRGIYILGIKDARLAGIEQVTSAHEFLHAAYERLGSKERARVNKLINDAYATITDERILSTIEDYRKDGADVTNEMHSILGTEVRNLPLELETYYKRYFTDRLKIVTYSEQYVNVFTEKQNKIKALSVQIDGLEKELIAQRAKLDSQNKALESESNRLDNLKKQGKIEEYNASASIYNNNLDKFRRDVNAYNAKLATYKSLISDYNDLAEQQRELNQVINSRISTQESK